MPSASSSTSRARKRRQRADNRIKLTQIYAEIANLQRQAEELEQQNRDIDEELQVNNSPNYDSEEFAWARSLRTAMRETFKIKEYRLCQRAVCNANVDGRDIVCVMPTGGGKSLTYQLPAFCGTGVTVVISPLISLISDQIMHLKELNVLAAKLTGSTSASESQQIHDRLENLIHGRPDRHLALLYVTPEKLSKSANFRALLQELADNRKLERFVVDEAHCVSTMGHDFRTDYRELNILRKYYPSVPIMALTATCPPKVLDDLVEVLCLKPICKGNKLDGTLYFTAPLYRPNLHYSVLAKPPQSKKAYSILVEYILEHHEGHCGVIYCTSKKQAEEVATSLQEAGIKTGFYHAEKEEHEKESLHGQWRRGEIKVICATTAFGMGIDKQDVRFVIHHSISKSLDGYYQESGRAGRDGKDADCVLFYRPQDAWTLAGMVNSPTGNERLFPMFNFVHDAVECRRLQFANYFSHSAELALSAWGNDAMDPCGHCDNCIRSGSEKEGRDVTLEIWQLVKLMQAVCVCGSRYTAQQIVELARKGATRKNASAETVDMERVCGGLIKLDKEDIEFLLVWMWTKGYVAVKCQQNQYGTNVYISAGSMAAQLLPWSKEEVSGSGCMMVTFLPKSRKEKITPNGKEKCREVVVDDYDEDAMFADDEVEITYLDGLENDVQEITHASASKLMQPQSSYTSRSGKGKQRELDEDVIMVNEDDVEEVQVRRRKRKSDAFTDADDSSSDPEWVGNMRGDTARVAKAPRVDKTRRPVTRAAKKKADMQREVIEILDSSDEDA
ncbi:ATP-dependent DNA helicase [Cylindrobasidium torrendii FP15055 ss-10]|uniref:ATP-dependent DNA helicase n=1 Tax=Cylindrobasidium torrendii FP15055 ss-10 TaxID=1314674 RepID=A0A0D7B4T8_9AGAR|nr:ATP-dependent DNA helicase [Cylindrobasidium torrendii FP15055 ss-10]